MMFNRRPTNLTYDDLQRAIAPLSQHLDAQDRKMDRIEQGTRTDLEQLRRDMQNGFNALDMRFVTRELAQQRYEELFGYIKALQNGDANRKQNTFTLGTYTVNWLLTGLGLLIGAISLLLVLHSH